MRTQLGTYCQQFDGTLRPWLQELATALHRLEHSAPDHPGRSLRAELTELQHHVQALCDKVAGQQAYVLIFGPLKSGKSTLMNAIAGAYVSEVSSLPAYPCLVFTSAGPARRYRTTDYDGRAVEFADATALHRHIEQAHGELAAAIRQTEQHGQMFDPQEHLPTAIRRVDVEVPASDLASTGAVLVDTPGLYTRMRFGYDRMTRDFRNAAACAIFVVKSDTLFLEQVFAEFQQLLDLFSRIFLVVNVDSHKRDVTADGTLVPSLEQSEPTAILRAFEHLAMSAGLQRAAALGKVKMYPVDLLHAAAGTLQKLPPDQQPAGFRAFRQDLADYLASSEYLAAFLRDSLQRAHQLLQQGQRLASSAVVQRLQSQLDELEAELEFVRGEQQRTTQALQLDWQATFARTGRELDAELERCARDAGAKLVRTLGASIDTWFLASHSLHWLVHDQWTPLVRDYRDEVHNAGRRTFEQQQAQAHAGLDLPHGLAELLRRAGVDLRALRAAALAELSACRFAGGSTVPVDPDAIPLKKGMVDHVLFRSLEAVRRRLFGPRERPDVKIPGKEKAARLGEPGRLFLHQCVAKFRNELAPATHGALRAHFGTALATAGAVRLQAALREYLPRLERRAAELAMAREALQSVLEPLRMLTQRAGQIEVALGALGVAFDQARDAVESVVVVPAVPAATEGTAERREPSARARRRG
ncbi:MAG: dynamin family protein [Planctomycetes bacterium]|nr:dynamin family protein [Planctomycetota bacterium]